MDAEKKKINDLDADDLASLARRYYTTRFPNPQRLGCPPAGEIVKVVSQRQVPDQALREHLFQCSECFGEYRQALAGIAPAVADVSWRKRPGSIFTSIFTLKRLSLAGMMALLILSSLLAGLIWRKRMSETGSGSVARSTTPNVQPAAAEPAPDQTIESSVAEVTKPLVESGAASGARRRSRGRWPGAETFEIDLDNYVVFRRPPKGKGIAAGEERSLEIDSETPGERPEGRNDAAPGDKIISLPSTRATLILRLPETGVPGRYEVSLIDAFGRPLLTDYASSPDGVELRVTLDLSRVSPKKYRLRLSRDGEAPAFYDVIVDASKGGRRDD